MNLPESAFNAEDILKDIVRWAEIESPSYSAASVNKVMDLAEAEMRDLGGVVERLPGLDGFGDVVVARFSSDRGQSHPGILVLSHLDTVHEIGTLERQLPIRRNGDRLYGPGVLDMKGGACLTIQAFKILCTEGVLHKLPITFMFTPDEEVGSPSSRGRIETEAAKHRYVLVAEPLRPWGDVVTGRHAVQRFWVRTHGQPSHAGLTKSHGRSAITKMAEIIQRIEAMNDEERGTTYAVGTIHGGNFVNVVAVACEVEVLCVAPTDDLLHQVRQNLQFLEDEADGVRVEVEFGLCRPIAKPHSKTMALYKHARRLATEIGIDLDHCQSAGGSDGNFTGALGIATLDGLGVAGAGAHTFDEHLLISSLVPRCRLIAGLFETLK